MRISIRAVAFACFLAIAPSDALSQYATQLGSHPTMTELVAEFGRSPVPNRTDLAGDWVNTTVVNTEWFLTGRSGADHIFSDANGFRRDDGRLDWTMSIGIEDGHVVFVSTTTWSDVERSAVAFSAGGEAHFSKDYGGDSAYQYRCRMPTSKRILCIIDKEPPGHAIEFRRIR